LTQDDAEIVPNYLLLVDESVQPIVAAKYREFSRAIANFAGQPAGFALKDAATIQQVFRGLGDAEVVQPPRGMGGFTPMGATPVVYRQDGQVDWGAMWATFYDLAMFGGPPLRGSDNPVNVMYYPKQAAEEVVEEIDLIREMQAPTVMSSARRRSSEKKVDIVWEIRRGIAETTGYYGKPYPAAPERPLWLGIMCETKKQAAWMSASTVLENVDSWCQETLYFVPCSPEFELFNEVRSIINVVAKVNYHWEQHLAGSSDDPWLNWDVHLH
jgi:hypothetical protein